jgi:calcium-dependent protein kinase
MDTNHDGRIQYEELFAWLALHDDEWDELRQSSLFQPAKGFSLAIFNESTIVDHYEVTGKKLGEGSFGSVCKAVNRTTGQARAVKSIPKANMDNSELQVEMEVMQKLDHPHILRLYEVFSDFFTVYLVMEICTGGPLFDRIVEERNFNERQAAVVMQQITGGIHYMHLKLVCHRDLKPENFLLQEEAPLEKAGIKIIDFGASKRFRKGHPMTTRVGTPFYVAPQVLQGNYDQSCDVWSIGVIMYILLSGGPPFCGNNPDEIVQQVMQGKYSFEHEFWEGISADAKNLIDKMLMYDPRERYSAGQVVDHVWIKDHAPSATNRPLQASQLKNMRTFCGQNKLKKAAMEAIAKGMQDDQIKALKEMFVTLDSNGDGTVTIQELRDGIDKLEIPGVLDNMQEVMEGIDTDGSGSIDYTEFIAATLDKKHYEEENACWSAFQLFDKDNSGTIDRKELTQVLKSETMEALVGAAGIEKILTECDQDGDGQISFQEFVGMMRNAGL